MYKYIATFLVATSLYASDMMVWQTPKGLFCTNGSQFNVIDEAGVHDVQPCFVDAKLRNRSMACLAAMSQHGYLQVNKLDNDTYKVNFNERGVGGGPVGATIGAVVGFFGSILSSWASGRAVRTVVETATGSPAAGEGAEYTYQVAMAQTGVTKAFILKSTLTMALSFGISIPF